MVPSMAWMMVASMMESVIMVLLIGLPFKSYSHKVNRALVWALTVNSI